MKWFISTHRVREDAIPTWMGATTKAEHEGIEFLGLAPEPAKEKEWKKSNYANGVRLKGIKGTDLVLSALPATMEEIAHAFVSKGFAVGSAATTVSKLVAEGKVERNGDKIYRKVAK